MHLSLSLAMIADLARLELLCQLSVVFLLEASALYGACAAAIYPVAKGVRVRISWIVSRRMHELVRGGGAEEGVSGGASRYGVRADSGATFS